MDINKDGCLVRARGPEGRIRYEQKFMMQDFPDALCRAQRNAERIGKLFPDCQVMVLPIWSLPGNV